MAQTFLMIHDTPSVRFVLMAAIHFDKNRIVLHQILSNLIQARCLTKIGKFAFATTKNVVKTITTMCCKPDHLEFCVLLIGLSWYINRELIYKVECCQPHTNGRGNGSQTGLDHHSTKQTQLERSELSSAVASPTRQETGRKKSKSNESLSEEDLGFWFWGYGMEGKNLLASLQRLFQNLGQCTEVDQLIQVTRAELQRTIGFNELWFHILSEDRTHVQLLETSGKPYARGKPGERFLIDGDAFLKELSRAEGPVIVEDARTDPRTDKEVVEKLGHRTIVCIPTRMCQGQVGFFCTGSFGDQAVRKLSESEQEYLHSIANHVTLLLEKTIWLERAAKPALNVSESDLNLRLAMELGLISLWDLDLVSGEPEGSSKISIPEIETRKNQNRIASFEKWKNKIHPEDRSVVTSLFYSYLQNADDRLVIDYRTSPNLGDVRQIISEGIILRNEHGEPVRLIGCHIDVTARRRAETASIPDETQISRFVHEAPGCMALFDTRMNCLATSGAWVNENGFQPKVQVGMNLYEGVPELPEYWKVIYNRALSGESLKNDCDHWSLPNGFTIWFSWFVRPWLNTSGQIGGIIISYESKMPGSTNNPDVIEIASKQQQRIGQDLHDTVSQELTALRMLTSVLRNSLDETQENLTFLVEQIEAGLIRGTQELRDIIHGLMPVQIHPDELIRSLHELAQRAERLGADRCILKQPGKELSEIDSQTATQLYLIAKEAVHNALKHCGPKQIEIKIETEPNLVLRIRNDCERPKEAMNDRHFGLGRQIMQNRASIIGAKLTIESLQPNGMQVTCLVERFQDESPYRVNSHARADRG